MARPGEVAPLRPWYLRPTNFTSAGGTYGVYLAANEQLIREHAQRAGWPAEIAAVRAMIDPTMRLPKVGAAA